MILRTHFKSGEGNSTNRDGYCMMNAIRASLLHDHNIDPSERNMQCKVWREVKNHIPFCVEFTVNKTQDEVLHDVNKYLRSYGKNYTLPVINVIIGACVNSLKKHQNI